MSASSCRGSPRWTWLAFLVFSASKGVSEQRISLLVLSAVCCPGRHQSQMCADLNTMLPAPGKSAVRLGPAADSTPEGGGGRAAGLWLQRRHQGCVGLTAWAPGSVSWGLPATHVVCACRRRVAQHQETQRSVTVPSPRRARSLVTSEAGNRVPTAAPSAAASPGPSKAPSMSSPAPVRRFWPPKLCMCCSLPQAPQGELGPAGPPAGFSCAEPVSPCRPPKPNPLLWALPAEVHSAGCGCSSLPGSKAAACVLVLTCGRGWKDLSCLLL
ncbi:PREDICTED: uncharacterized protein LOC106146682 isoform X5 [Chinchilla lanigera]|uniref:uncharacterized protein LOC106146682 isoform X5 n=1 Tax=Chinchilla lanigera TaxID=34839 RepID=UPI0006967805|nr:PREDICTED: uncharacterized protein LOC106146682 isoform X5 [Chinchilla lanigera]